MVGGTRRNRMSIHRPIQCWTLSQSGPDVKMPDQGKKAKQKVSRKWNSTHVSAFPVGPNSGDVVRSQAILDIFQTALPVSDIAGLTQTIQQVKGHLFRRDFAAAFGDQKCLQAYAMRWSAARALAYTDILTALEARHKVLGGPQGQVAKVVCVGGGAGAEVVALSAAVKNLDVSPISVVALDSADWSSALRKISSAVVEPPALPPYASAARREANQAFLDPARLQYHFQQRDVLELADEDVKGLLTDVSLVTIMFTMNELFSSSMAKATKFLLQLGEAPVGTWLLVVDSPGSYSEVSLGDTSPRRYPMQFLLDHILLKSTEGTWAKVQAEDSKWFRVSSGLSYPLELENTRYQLHLYKRENQNG